MGDVRMCTQLLDRTGVPVDLVHPGLGGETTLSVASKNGNLDVVSLLLGRDDGVDLCGADSMAQLYFAAPEIARTHESRGDVTRASRSKVMQTSPL
jgi:hypothetical protein